METLHDKIMNIPIHKSKVPETIITELTYKSGHRDARHAAAELANEADGIISELLHELEAAKETIHSALQDMSVIGFYGSHADYDDVNRMEALIAKAKGESNV